MQKKCLILLICLLSLITSGCWDRRELQERTIVLAVGIDTADMAQTNYLESFPQPHGDKRYRLSLQVLKMSSGKSSSDSKTYVISNTGQSLFEMDRNMLGQLSKSLWFEHIQCIVISEQAVKQDNLAAMLDFFFRDAEMRSRIKIFITPNTAYEVLNFQPLNDEPGGLYLANILQNNSKNPNMNYPQVADLGNIRISLANHQDQITPKLEMSNKIVKTGGSAVFQQGHFVGYIDSNALAGVRFIRSTEKSAPITASLPERPEEVAAMEIVQHDNILTPHIEEDSIYFTLEISIHGNLSELENSSIYNTVKTEDIAKLEMIFAEEVKQKVLYGYQAVQELGIDQIGFSRLLKAKYPAKWSEIKEKWPDVLRTVPLYVYVNVTIENIGKHK